MPRPDDTPLTAQSIELALLVSENDDPDALRNVPAPAPVWHAPGHNLLSGDHMGREQVVQYVREARDLTGGTLRVTERSPLRMRGDEGRVVLHLEARRGGRRLDTDATVRVRLEEGRVAELWTTPAEPEAWDGFWAP